ncbi:kazal-type serine protease inhibitor domain-containing protein [Cryptosporidium muris RN66]|uniref:Kazal-type serine protease inhibitor domain-containing protein n=1 Tax=Cryptosporidium muris (strain RN66) TaxID=441375 RepID=B6AIY9_CRYMR|nr:kazal-type serine protease inhibitor domain-containing protein [Cryptosporidium muris RN66]EEA08180.1 kazal-type serine protease inhibitor domain-containing protein [Cryptosporidium muris RN66]|eukprot:XP_002142529.1 kazal-type serine protease inhibitor domain-containing protein [Cryptosporidium muris RN66]
MIKFLALIISTAILTVSATGIFRDVSDIVTDSSNPCHVTCPREYAPVCATDAETYLNICLFGVANCINKDLKIVANVTCPDLLVHLTYVAQKGVVDSANAFDATLGTVETITKGTGQLIAATINTIPTIGFPTFGKPFSGFPLPLNTTSESNIESGSTTTTTVSPQVVYTSGTSIARPTQLSLETSTNIAGKLYKEAENTSISTVETSNRSDYSSTTKTAESTKISGNSLVSQVRNATPTRTMLQVGEAVNLKLSNLGNGISDSTTNQVSLNNIHDTLTTIEGLAVQALDDLSTKGNGLNLPLKLLNPLNTTSIEDATIGLANSTITQIESVIPTHLNLSSISEVNQLPHLSLHSLSSSIDGILETVSNATTQIIEPVQSGNNRNQSSTLNTTENLTNFLL